jgi:hypothetical protein
MAAPLVLPDRQRQNIPRLVIRTKTRRPLAATVLPTLALNLCFISALSNGTWIELYQIAVAALFASIVAQIEYRR